MLWRQPVVEERIPERSSSLYSCVYRWGGRGEGPAPSLPGSAWNRCKKLTEGWRGRKGKGHLASRPEGSIALMVHAPVPVKAKGIINRKAEVPGTRTCLLYPVRTGKKSSWALGSWHPRSVCGHLAPRHHPRQGSLHRPRELGDPLQHTHAHPQPVETLEELACL